MTFNFDSIIRDYLDSAITRAYRGSTEVALALEAIKVIHVHGQLLPPPKNFVTGGSFGDINNEWTAWVRAATAEINIVQDSINEQTLTNAHDALRKAQVICFLGFAYHPDNLRRLDIANTIKDDSVRQHVFGSAFGLSLGEHAWMQSRFKKISLGNEKFGCRQVLRDFHIFRD